MQIEEIFQELDSQVGRFYEKAKLARETARKAHKRGNMHKRDKFHAIARVYEMVLEGIDPLVFELLQHTSKEFQDKTTRATV